MCCLTLAAKQDIKLTSRSRPLKPEELAIFDYIMIMDAINQENITVGAKKGLRIATIQGPLSFTLVGPIVT